MCTHTWPIMLILTLTAELFRTAHTHLQQPNVARGQSWDSEKHIWSFFDGFPLKPGMSYRPDITQAPLPGLPGWESHLRRICPWSGVCSDNSTCALMQDSLVGPYNVSFKPYITDSLQVVCLRGLQELAHRDKGVGWNRRNGVWGWVTLRNQSMVESH